MSEQLIWEARYDPAQRENYPPSFWMRGMPDQLILTNGTIVTVEFKDDILTVKRREE